jgi:hypothetical protein
MEYNILLHAVSPPLRSDIKEVKQLFRNIKKNGILGSNQIIKGLSK